METKKYLPKDKFAGTLIVRVWHTDPSGVPGPSPALIRDGNVFDLAGIAATVSEIINDDSILEKLSTLVLPMIADYDSIMKNSLQGDKRNLPYFLAPVDIQPVKACGVTFVISMLERVIEERAEGDNRKANEVRKRLNEKLDVDFSQIVPGSPQAETLKYALQSEGMWSQYLEVGLGPYAEIFSKAQPLSSVGIGAEVGINRISMWNNPEPEVVLIINNRGEIKGAALGNDVNLRDIEGRSALLLGKAKDNNASCSIGPFIRIIDNTFSLDHIRNMKINLQISGIDGFELNDSSDMNKISRDITDLVAQTINESHQYPDGLALFTGTLFAPTADRGAMGTGFTHHIGDTVCISSDDLGMLQNSVNYSDLASPWTFGISQFYKNLEQRSILRNTLRREI